MKPYFQRLLVSLAVTGAAVIVSAETVRFTDGTHIDVTSYEIREHVVILVTADGKLRSVPKSFVRLDELADEEAMIAEAIELTGLRRLTDEIASSACEAAEGLDEGPTSELLADAMTEGFASERIYRAAEATFREQASSVRLGAALEWLRSPFARRMERAESFAEGASLEDYVERLEAAPPSVERVELLLRLDRASGTSEAAVEMQAAMMTALLQGMYPAGPGTEHAIDEAVDNVRPKLARKTRNRIQLSLHFMYRDISDAELTRYVTYLESDTGEWLSRLLLQSLFAAMEDGARRSGQVLAERLLELTKLKV